MIQQTLRQLALSRHWPILLSAIGLTLLGVLCIYADKPELGKKQLVFFGVAFACLMAFQMIDYRIIGLRAVPFYVVSAGLILYTVIGHFVGGVPGVANVKGAYNWINFGAFSLQPSELMKVAYVMVMARFFRFRSNYRTWTGLIPPFLLTAFPMLIILGQPDLGTALVFIPTALVMLFVAGAKVKHLVGVVLGGVSLMPLIWLIGLEGIPVLEHLPSLVKDYQRDRVYAMFSEDPDVAETGTGMQQNRTMIAFASGGFFGKGYGNISYSKRVPEHNNDMILAVIGEQFGFVGAMVALGAYLLIFWIGADIAGSTREPFGRMVAVGVVVMMAAQTFINLMVALSLMPVTGVTLPFISSGGSSLIASFMSIGLLLNIGQKRVIVMGREAFEFEE